MSKGVFDMTDPELMQMAERARERAHAPYSGYKVGAALLGADGRVFTGCNIENAAYSPSICAERAALSAAVSSGCRSFTKIAVAGSGSGLCTPCGVCRQSLFEFSPDMSVLCLGEGGTVSVFSLRELLPYAFSASDLEK
jgi:cytidine deaminase